MFSRILVHFLAFLNLKRATAQYATAPKFEDGFTLKITIIPSHFFLWNVTENPQVPINNDEVSGYFNQMIGNISESSRANFKYELYLPSGFGKDCTPRAQNANQAYNSTYRTQYNCGANDVTDPDVPPQYRTDVYWALYYITNDRLLTNRFTIPYIPPAEGALTMYGTATGIQTFDDLIAKQAQNEAKPACVGQGAAYVVYLRSAFPNLEMVEVSNTDSGFYDALVEDKCDVMINAYPTACDFVGTRYVKNQCQVNSKPVGIIGDSLGYGLNPFSIGVSYNLTINVTDTINYWLFALMQCAPGDQGGECPSSTGGSLYEAYEEYWPYTGDGSMCGYVNGVPSSDSSDNDDDDCFDSATLIGSIFGVGIFCSLTASFIAYTLHSRQKQSLLQYIRSNPSNPTQSPLGGLT